MKMHNSTNFQPILMKFDTQVHIDMPNLKISKPEVLAGNKMAAAAIFAKINKMP